MAKKISYILLFLFFFLASPAAAQNDLTRILKKDEFREKHNFSQDILQSEPHASDYENYNLLNFYYEQPHEVRFVGVHRIWIRYLNRYYSRFAQTDSDNFVNSALHPSRAIGEYLGIFESYLALSSEKKFLENANLPWRINGIEKKPYIIGKETNLIDNQVFYISPDMRIHIQLENLEFLRNLLTVSASKSEILIPQRRNSLVQYPAIDDSRILNSIRFKARINVKFTDFQGQLIKSTNFSFTGTFDRHRRLPISIDFSIGFDFEDKNASMGLSLVI